MFVDVLHPQLESGRDARLERSPEPVRERPADVLRADQIELCGLGPLRRRKVDRVERCFVLRQASTFEVEAP
jgi:hypothetical protein